MINRTPKGNKDTKADSPYTRIDNGILDSDLSPFAKLAMWYLLSKPDDWELRTDNLQRFLKCGRNKTEAIIKELKITGYIDRRQKRYNGQWTTAETIIYEKPNTETAAEFQTAAELSENNRAALLPDRSMITGARSRGHGDGGPVTGGYSNKGILTTDLKTTDLKTKKLLANEDDPKKLKKIPQMVKLAINTLMAQSGIGKSQSNRYLSLYIKYDNDPEALNWLAYALTEAGLHEPENKFAYCQSILSEIKKAGGLLMHKAAGGGDGGYSYNLASRFNANDDVLLNGLIVEIQKSNVEHELERQKRLHELERREEERQRF